MSNANRDFYLRLVEQRPDINSRFTAIKRLGPKGGDGHFSLLFSARDLTTQQVVALKMYNPDEMNPNRWQSFAREAQILQSLAGQPDIIGLVAPFSEFLETVEFPQGLSYNLRFAYYALELALGSVAEGMANHAWDAEHRLLAFRMMCRAVQRIHEHGIVHRDLKPENFLVMPNGSIKLTDFGAARLCGNRTPPLPSTSVEPLGEITYTAPEMLASLQNEHPRIAFGADMYSLGAILFELFSGTTLAYQIYDPTFAGILMTVMSTARHGKRTEMYHRFIRTMVAAHPLPSVAGFGAAVPSCILQQIDTLYRSVVALDYRERLGEFQSTPENQLPSFQSIFRQIQTCLLILRNEQKYHSWLEEKRRRLARLRAKLVSKGGRS